MNSISSSRTHRTSEQQITNQIAHPCTPVQSLIYLYIYVYYSLSVSISISISISISVSISIVLSLYIYIIVYLCLPLYCSLSNYIPPKTCSCFVSSWGWGSLKEFPLSAIGIPRVGSHFLKDCLSSAIEIPRGGVTCFEGFSYFCHRSP